MINFKCIFVTFFFAVIFQCDGFSFTDCYYNETTNHVEYICGDVLGYKFQQKTLSTLYCGNYDYGIDRAAVAILSIRDCEQDKLPYEFFSLFPGIRTFNISFIGLDYISPDFAFYHTHLENVIATNNKFSELDGYLFKSTPNLTSVDFSSNLITHLNPDLFENRNPKLKIINFSDNLIDYLYLQLFQGLISLESLDISNNLIQIINSDVFVNNKNLRSLHLINNQIDRLECDFLLTLADSRTLNITLNSLEDLVTSCSEDQKQINSNVSISRDNLSSMLKIDNGEFEWIFSEKDFNKLRRLNLSDSQMLNTSMILQEANDQLESLDLSNTFVGKLDEKTFQRFGNLEQLRLSRTNLSNFGFKTMYHQRNLKLLDISYNNLNKIDLHLFIRTFNKLETLNVEGNNLTEIDSIKQSHFPKLSLLGISRNNFSCDYLHKIFLEWPDLDMIDNPAGQIHMGGVDCLHSEISSTLIPTILMNSTTEKNLAQLKADHLNLSTSNDLFGIKILLSLIVLLLALIFITSKCKHPLKRVKDRLMYSFNEYNVGNNEKNGVDMQQVLMEQQ